MRKWRQRGFLTNPKSHKLEVAETKFNPSALNKSHSLCSGVWLRTLLSQMFPWVGDLWWAKGYNGPEEIGWTAYLGSWLRGSGAATLRTGSPGDPWRSNSWRGRMGWVRLRNAEWVPPNPRCSPERGLMSSLSHPGGLPQSASGDRDELSSKDSVRLWGGQERG